MAAGFCPIDAVNIGVTNNKWGVRYSCWCRHWCAGLRFKLYSSKNVETRVNSTVDCAKRRDTPRDNDVNGCLGGGCVHCICWSKSKRV